MPAAIPSLPGSASKIRSKEFVFAVKVIITFSQVWFPIPSKSTSGVSSKPLGVVTLHRPNWPTGTGAVGIFPSAPA